MRNSGSKPFHRSIYHASADFAHRRMTHRSLGAFAPTFLRPPSGLREGASASAPRGRRWVWSLATTGLPVKLLGEIYPSGSSLPAKPFTYSHLSLPENLGNRNFSRQLIVRYH